MNLSIGSIWNYFKIFSLIRFKSTKGSIEENELKQAKIKILTATEFKLCIILNMAMKNVNVDKLIDTTWIWTASSKVSILRSGCEQACQDLLFSACSLIILDIHLIKYEQGGFFFLVPAHLIHPAKQLHT